MQLPESDLLQPKPLAAFDRLIAQIASGARPSSMTGIRPRQPGFSRDENAVIRVQRFVDKLLRDFRTVGVRGVDEIDSKLR